MVVDKSKEDGKASHLFPSSKKLPTSSNSLKDNLEARTSIERNLSLSSGLEGLDPTELYVISDGGSVLPYVKEFCVHLKARCRADCKYFSDDGCLLETYYLSGINTKKNQIIREIDNEIFFKELREEMNQNEKRREK